MFKNYGGWELYFDFDDVIKPLVKRWVMSINENLEEDIEYEDVKTFDVLGKDRYLSLLAPDKFDHESGEPEIGAV